MRHGWLRLSLVLVLVPLGTIGCKSFGSGPSNVSLWERMRPGSSTPKMASQSPWKDPLSQPDVNEDRPGRLACAWEHLRGRDPQAKQQADMKMTFGQMQESQGATDAAVKCYEEALKLDPKRTDAHWRLATLLDRQGQGQQSDEHFRKAIAKDSKNANIKADYGYSLYLRGLADDAEKQLRAALKTDPNNRRAHNNLGLVLAAQRLPDEALKEFRKAGCNNAEAHANLGFALALQGNIVQAEESYQTALAADPNLRSAQDGLKSLTNVAANMEEADARRAEMAQSEQEPRSTDGVDQAEAKTPATDEADVGGTSTSRIRRVRPVLFGKPSAK